MGDHHLHHDRHQPDQGQGCQQNKPVLCEANTDQGQSGNQQLHQQQALALDQIAQRYDQDQPKGITRLGRTDYPTDLSLRHPQVTADRLEQRLGEIDRGHCHGAGGGKQQGYPAIHRADSYAPGFKLKPHDGYLANVVLICNQMNHAGAANAR